MNQSRSPVPLAHYQKTVFDLKECITELKSDFEDNCFPINDDSQILQRFCGKLEYLLQAGLKVRTGLLGGKKDYWNYICDCAAGNKSLSDGVRFVKAINELKTSLGKGRAYIRFSLMHQRLADTIQQCVQNSKITNDWYHNKTIWFHPHLTSDVISALYDLNDIQFDLSPRGYDLDDSWPTFARKTLGVPQMWTPPSRSTSIGSLSSIPNHESSFHSTSFHGAEADVDRLQRDLSESERRRLDFENHMESLENEKLATESKLDRVQVKVENVEDDLRTARRQADEYKIEIEKLKKELEMKEEAWKEKENLMADSLSEANTALTEMGEKLEASSSRPAAANFDTTELKMKLFTQEKKVAALTMELKGCNNQITMQQQVDTKKNELVNVLDQKLKRATEGRDKLLSQLEGLVKDKTTFSEKLTKSSKQLGEMADILEAKEKYIADLKSTNKELSEMLHSLEEKSSKIARLAKEKVIKYSEANKELQATIDQLRNETKSESKESSDNSVTVTPSNKDSSDNSVTVTPSNMQSQYFQREEELIKYKGQMENFYTILQEMQNNKQMDEEGLAKALQASEALSADIKHEIIGLKKELETRGETGAKSDKEFEVLREENTNLKELVYEQTVLLKSFRQREPELEEGEEQNDISEEPVQEEGDGQAMQDEPTLESSQSATVQTTDVAEQRVTTESVQSRDNIEGSVQLESENITDLSSQLLQAKLEIADLKTLLCQHETQLVDTEAKLEHRDIELTQKTSTICDLEQKQSQLSCEMEKYVDEHQSSLSEKDQKLADLTSKMDHLNQELFEIRASYNSTVTQYEQLKLQSDQKQNYLTVLEQKVSVSEDHVKSLEKTVEIVKCQCESLEELNLNISAEKENLDLEVTRLREHITDLQDACKQLETAQMPELRQKLKNEEKVKESLVADLQNLKTLHEEKEKQIEDLQAKLRCGEEENGKKLEELKRFVDMRNQETEARALNETQRVQEYEKLKTECEIANNEIRHLKDSCLCKDSLTQDLTSKNTEINDLYEITLKEKTDLERTFESTLLSFTEMQAKFEDLKNECENAKLAVVERETTIAAVESENASLAQEISVLMSEQNVQTESLNQSAAEYFRRITGLESEKKTLKDKMDSIVLQKQELEHTLRENHKLLEAKLLALTKEYEIEKHEKAEKVEEISSLTDKIEFLHTQGMERESQIRSLEAQLEDKCQNVDQGKAALVEMERKMDEVRCNLQQNVNDLQEELCRIKEDHAKHVDDWEAQARNWNVERDTREKELSSLRFQLSAEQMQQEQAAKNLAGHEVDVDILVTKVTEQEAVIESLDVELRELKEIHQVESERHFNELQNVKQYLSEKEKKCIKLGNQLDESARALEAEKVLALQTKEAFNEQLTEYKDDKEKVDQDLQQLRTEFDLLTCDNSQLKKRLIQLLREKDSLWQETDRLQYQQKLKASDKWMDDNLVNNCLSCKAEFSFLLRKHHCRLCGRIFCHDCASHWILTPHSSKEERVCNECYTNQNDLEPEPEVEPEEGADSNDFLVSTEIPTKKSKKWQNSAIIAEGSPSGASLEREDSYQEQTVSMWTDADVMQQPQSPVEESATTETPSRDLESSGLAEDEAYDVITDEEIAKSQQDPLPDPNVSFSSVVGVDEIGQEGVEAEPELWIKAGKAYAVPVVIDTPGVALAWEFTTTPKGVNFVVTYKENVFVADDQVETLIPSTKCNSHKQAVQGELIARKAGVYTLLFDNYNSRFTSKKLNYKLHMTKPVPAE